MRQLIAILGVAILAGCASNAPEQKPQPQTAPAENDKPARVSRELSMAWDNMGRGGAALRQPGYIHVLGDGNVSATMNKVKDDSAGSDKTPAGIKQHGDVNEAINTFKSMNKGKGYSLYELSRWERARLALCGSRGDYKHPQGCCNRLHTTYPHLSRLSECLDALLHQPGCN